jgi:hypothetical protein
MNALPLVMAKTPGELGAVTVIVCDTSRVTGVCVEEERGCATPGPVKSPLGSFEVTERSVKASAS